LFTVANFLNCVITEALFSVFALRHSHFTR